MGFGQVLTKVSQVFGKGGPHISLIGGEFGRGDMLDPKVQNLAKLRSETTNLRFETTHPEEKSAPERSGGVPGSRNAIKLPNMEEKCDDCLEMLKVRKRILRI